MIEKPMTAKELLEMSLEADDAMRRMREALANIRSKVHAHNRGGEIYAGLRDTIRDICDEALQDKQQSKPFVCKRCNGTGEEPAPSKSPKYCPKCLRPLDPKKPDKYDHQVEEFD